MLFIGLGIAMLLFGLLAALPSKEQDALLRKEPARCGALQETHEQVRLLARLVARPPLIAPLSGTQCVAYRLTVSWGERREHVQHSTLVVAEHPELTDDSGACPLQLEGGRLNFTSSIRKAVGITNRDLLPIAEQVGANLPFMFDLVEERLETGSDVMVVGVPELHGGKIWLGGDTPLELWAGGEQHALAMNKAGRGMGFVVMAAGVVSIVYGVVARED